MAPEQKAIATLRISRQFDAAPQAVFEAWTRPEALTQWFAPGRDMRTEVIDFDLRTGGRYRIRMVESGTKAYTVGGAFVEIDAPSLLAFTWAWEPLPGETPLDYSASRVTVRFQAAGGETELVLLHERLPTEAMRTEHEHGWNGCLDRLADLL